MGWVVDGVDSIESRALSGIVGICRAVCNDAPDGLEEFSGGASVASSVVSMGWIQNGIDNNDEARAISLFEDMAEEDAGLASSVVSLDWVRDGVEELEFHMLHRMVSISRRVCDYDADGIKVCSDGVTLALAILSLDWVQDGIKDDAEISTIAFLDRTTLEYPELTSFLVSRDWVQDGIGNDAGDTALVFLGRLASSNRGAFDRLMSGLVLANDTIAEQAAAVAELGAKADDKPGSLDPDRVMVEQRTITLPLTGEVLLTISRTRLGAARSMDLLEHSVRTIESLMGTPFPTKYVGVLYDDYVLGFAGVNFGTHVAILRKYDVSEGDPHSEISGLIIAHEVAHYYWSSNLPWIDEGLSQAMVRLVEHVRVGTPVEPRYVPCPYVRTIAELEALAPNPGDDEFHCNSLGEGLFLDLYDMLGEADFLRKVSQLYAKSLVQAVGIEEVREAFGAEDGAASAVIDRWYYGGKS